ncbi:succinate dehydrogenase assembly factor 4, mitochondrial [Protopterus annectens]|uniref:succinate dehydrogenase assembly factor 4, mitochondrial n=1 Tax=Protopterus annectens TaxID=7888 RepID=UPI001CFB8118|nr:succinate dehydrogenase assembly factor 4, mitochondrial [Protopterus annectens]
MSCLRHSQLLFIQSRKCLRLFADELQWLGVSYLLPVSCNIRVVSLCTKRKSEPKKEHLRKPKTPLGRFDSVDEPQGGKDPLERFPNDINPITKEKGGPRGPEPTRYGDWERKGRCIDF